MESGTPQPNAGNVSIPVEVPIAKADPKKKASSKKGRQKGAGKSFLARLGGLPASLQPPKKILALEITGDLLLGALIEKKLGRMHVRNFVSIERTVVGEDLPDSNNIKELMERLSYAGGPAVLVTPMARAVQLSMSRQKAKKLGQYQLCDVLRWEVESYTGITGTAALVGAVKGDPSASEEELLLMEEEEVEIEINASAIERNVYRAIKQIFKRCNLRLTRLYPPEACFFMPLFLEPVEASMAVFDIGTDYANFAVIKGKQPQQINTYPLSKEILLDHMESEADGEVRQSLEFMLNQVPGPLPLVVTGIGAGDKKIIDYLDQRCPHGARPFILHREEKLVHSDYGAMNAMFCRVVGSGIRELFPTRWQLIGISDAVPLVVQLRRSAYVVPLVVAVLMIGSLLGHYSYMKNVRASWDQQNSELQKDLSERKASYDAYDKIKNRRDELQKQASLFERQLRFLEQGTDDNLIHIEKVMRAFFQLPDSMQLNSLKQGENGSFLMEGFSEDVGTVSDFGVYLQQYTWCDSVKIVAMREMGEGALEFRIDLRTIREED